MSKKVRYGVSVLFWALLVSAFILFLIGMLDFAVLYTFFRKETTLEGDILPYVLAEKHQTSLPSRKWMDQTIELVREENISAYQASQYFAYAASTYNDVLAATGSSQEGSIATARLLEGLFPKHREEIAGTLFRQNVGGAVLSPTAQEILDTYTKLRATSTEDSSFPFWYSDANAISIPPPPGPQTWKERFEVAKFVNMVNRRIPDHEEIIFFWDGIDSFYERKRPTITVAGVWQNILFVETRNTLNDAPYALHQKALAQGIADAFTLAEKAKVQYQRGRPATRIPNINLLLTNPEDSGYISEYAAAAGAAHTILSAAIPDKIDQWNEHARNAINSRILGGVNDDADSKAGAAAGSAVGNIVAQTFYSTTVSEKLLGDYTSSGFVQNFLFAVSEMNGIRQIRNVLRPLYLKKLSDKGALFENVSETAGLDLPLDVGAAWSDFDNDLDLDLLVSTGLYKNIGDGTFEHVAQKSNKLKAPAFWGDFNNDGCVDVYVVISGHATSLDTPGTPDVLYKNNCDGTFTDVTLSAHINDVFHGVSASWADYDNDGYLDIYVLNRGVLLSDLLDDPSVPYKFEPNILYHNNGNGTFTNVTNKAGADGILACSEYMKDANGFKKKMKVPFQPLWFDYNNDSYVDLFLVSDTFASPLYRNNQDGTFTQVTKEAGLCKHEHASNMGASVADYNHDGYLDIYVTNAGDNFLWKNNGNGTFSDVANVAAANDQGYGWGTVFFDYDNDGNDDILVTNGNNRLRAEYIKVKSFKKRNDLDELFKNNGDSTFTPMGEKEAIFSSEIKFTSSVADYDNNGFFDIFIPIHGDRNTSATSILYRNKGNDNHWITIKLIGTKSNKDGFGARIQLKNDSGTQTHEVMNGSSYIGQSSPWQTFGLGKSTQIDTLTIHWPSGETQTFDNNIPIDQMVIITEGSAEIQSPIIPKSLSTI